MHWPAPRSWAAFQRRWPPPMPHSTKPFFSRPCSPARWSSFPANIAILPLQLRLVYQVGQRYGQQLDANQVKDLAGTFGIGAAAQAVEGIIRKALGSVASGLLGGLFGGATGVAAGAAVSFATTYALGHAAKQYYAQGRKLSAGDLRALFSRFRGEAKDLLPKVQGQIQSMAGSLKLPDVLSQLRGL
jgi:uncharacterized protein (DUF697 family)